MHRRGARKGNQDAAIFCRKRTPCTGRWLSRAISPVPRYLRRKGDSICPLRSKRDQNATRGCSSHREQRPRPPGPARDPPSLGPEEPCPPHHLAPRPAPAARKRAACGPPQTGRRFRLRPLHHSNLAPAASRTYLRRAAAAEAATAAPPSSSPSPVCAGTAARGWWLGQGV